MEAGPSVVSMALATAPRARLWDSTVGKKAVMAVTGVIMLLFLVVHMLGNLKIFFGPESFDGYAAWLRTIGEPVLHNGWYLWVQRTALLACVVLHGLAAYQLSRRDLAARPTGYAHRRRRASYATRTMRWGGVILGLFIVWHILDLTTLTVNPRGRRAVRTRTWWPTSGSGGWTSSTSWRCSRWACTSGTASGARRRRWGL